jgi:methylenetetrahydrofolate dehydrogenase (NADP+) / methenyltetrahydrofolate cyclohydrolase
MAARILNGTEIAEQIKAEVAAEVKRLAAQGVRPGLAAVLVGDDPASAIYVRSKIKACDTLGLLGEEIRLPASVSAQELLERVAVLNRRDDIDGILVQLPLPAHIDKFTILSAISPEKDVDGLHPVNAGLLDQRRDSLVPCTPAGVMELLRRNQVATSGVETVVVGRSNIVGKPMAMLLSNADATVTLCHSKTRDLASVTRRADLLVVAVGKPGLITREHVKPGATVVDIGINRLETAEQVNRFFPTDAKRQMAFAKNGYVLVGDVCPDVAEVAGALTPVPGGVGPLTIAMLMVNTLKAARVRRGTGEGARPHTTAARAERG